jgi:hypothetical protein
MNATTPFDRLRLADLVRFYEILATLETKIGSPRKLSACSGRMDWPKRGVYFFLEQGENRSDSSHRPRIVRVGTQLSRLVLVQNFGLITKSLVCFRSCSI